MRRRFPSETVPQAAARGCPLRVAMIGDRAGLFRTFTGYLEDNQRHEIQAKSVLLLVVDRQLHTAALSALFSRVSGPVD